MSHFTNFQFSTFNFQFEKMTILVTGANGQLGNEMRIVTKGFKDKYIFTDVCDEQPDSIEMLHKLAGDDIDTSTTILDITNLDAIRQTVKDNDVKVIVNCAAWTNVDGAEDPEKYELVEMLNAKAPENLAIAMKEVGGLLVHISTDYVFGGDPYNTPCREDQKGTPTGVYGLTKLHGEQNIQATGVDHLIFRTAWLYSEFGKNFVKTMLNLTATKPQLKVVFDQVGTPTYARDLADVILEAIEDYKKEILNSQLSMFNYSKSGVYHFSNEGVCSWFDFTKMIADYSGQTLCDIQPCHSDEFPSPVKRPAFSVLDKNKVKDTFGIKVPYWTDSLKVCIDDLK
jgi:dTDP-4-dehydrorhamnose reductase